MGFWLCMCRLMGEKAPLERMVFNVQRDTGGHDGSRVATHSPPRPTTPHPTPMQLDEFGRDQGEEKMRSAIGRFGVTGPMQTLAMSKLSDGVKARVVFAWLAQRTPHMLLLDEPTNHLDMETIDSVAAAINGAWLGRGWRVG